MAPVSVAISTRCVAPSCCAYQSPSPRISRPSASVFTTSTVLPDALFRTSPGLMARPPGMFSAIGMTPITRSGTPSVAMARIAQATAAPPAMSSFIRSMSCGGLDRDAARVERDAFADQPEHGRCRRSRRLVTNHDQPRRLAAPAADAEQHAHAETRERVVLEHLDGKAATAREFSEASGKHGRRQRVAGLVVELARHVAVLADDAPLARRARLPSSSSPR